MNLTKDDWRKSLGLDKMDKPNLEQEFQTICKKYKPKIEDWLKLLKKQYPFTYTQILKK
jgi:hypothetical protein